MKINRFNGTISNLNKASESGTKIYLYGAGDAGKITYQLLDICGVKVDAFLDNNPDKKDTVVAGDVKCCTPQEVDNKNTCVVFVCINWCRYDSLYEQAKTDGFSQFCELSDVIDDVLLYNRQYLQEFIRYLGEYDTDIDIIYPGRIEKKHTLLGKAKPMEKDRKIAVYTGSFGDYDDVFEPKFLREDIDYYYISDVRPNVLNVFQWIDAHNIIPNDITSPILRNRYIKMHPHRIFPEYDRTIYMDTNLEITGDMTQCICSSDTGISVHNHYNRDCIYYEAMQLANYRRIPWQDSYNQIVKYLDEGFPIHYGLGEMPVVAIDHTHPDADKIMEEWWDELNKGAMRDQLSFMYVLWKLGYTAKDVASIGDEYRKSNYFILHKHNYTSKMVSGRNRCYV